MREIRDGMTLSMGRIMVLAAVLIILPCLSSGQGSPSSPTEQQFRDKLSDSMRSLAKNVLKSELRNRDLVKVNKAFTWKLGTIQGTSASTFRSFNQSFILAGKVLYQMKEGSVANEFYYETVAKFPEFLGEVAFIESVEWDGLLYLLAAYDQGFMQLFTVAPNNQVTLQQSINCYGVPTDAEFFTQNDNLFLVVAAQNSPSLVPIVIYRWSGTHLDQEDSKLLIEAKALSTFPFQESVIIVVALGASSNQKAGLAILQHNGKKLRTVQFLFSDNPLALQHFTFRFENYILLTKSSGSSIIYWWTGTELVEWDIVENSSNIRSIGVGYIRGETILLLAEKTSIKMYRPTASTLQFIDEQKFTTSVQSASLYIQKESIFMLALTLSADTFVPYVLELQLIFQPASVNHRTLARDPLLQCFSQLEVDLQRRKSVIEGLSEPRKLLLQKNSPVVFPGKLIVKELLMKGAKYRNLKLKAGSLTTSPAMPVHELRNQLSQAIQSIKVLTEKLKNVVFKSLPSSFSGRLVADHLEVHKAHMDSVTITNLNGYAFDPKTILMYNKDQKLTGSINGESIVTDSLTVGSLNHMEVKDLLLRKGHQTVLGLQRVISVKANSVVISPQGNINGIRLNRIVTSKLPGVISVKGSKTFANLNLQQLAVDLLNNVNFTQWISSLQPSKQIPPLQTNPTKFGDGIKKLSLKSDLIIQNLTVQGTINGVKLDDLLSSLFLRGINQMISGDVTYTKNVTATDLTASRINKVPSVSLMTRTTNQVISGSLVVEHLAAPDLLSDKINGLLIHRDAAYVNSPFSVSTPVLFHKLQSRELILPPFASIAGLPVGNRLLHKPQIMYEGRVKVKGSLQLTDCKLKRPEITLQGALTNIKNLHLHYWTKNTNQIFSTLQTSVGLNVKVLNIRTINNIHVEDFVDLSSTKVLQGSWHLPHAVVSGHVLHNPKAVQLPIALKDLSASIVKTSGKFTVSGSKVFEGGLSTTHLKSEYLDSKRVSDLFNKDAKGSSLYEEIFIGGNLVVHSDLEMGSFNKINLCERLSKALLTDSTGHIPAASMSSVTALNVDVNTFNAVPFSVIARNQSSTSARVRKVTLKGNIKIPAFVNVFRVNNKALSQDYFSRVVDRTKSGLIRGRKTFASQLDIRGSLFAYEYNGVKLEDLSKTAFSKTRDQKISARIFMDEMKTKELKAAVLNGIPLGYLLSSDLMSRQTIQGDLVFSNEVDVLGLLSAATFESHCDISVVREKLKALDGRHWTSINVEGSLDWERSLPERVPGLSYYLGSAVTKDSEQVIAAEVVFRGLVSVKNFNSRKDINDIDISNILSDSLRRALPHQVIQGSKVFAKRLQSTSMRVVGNVVAKSVAGVEISSFNSSLIRINSDQTVRGHKRFLQGFSARMLKVDGTLNGLTTSYIANYDMPILPPIHFIGPLVVTGDLNFDRVNDFSLDELIQERVTLNGPQQLEGQITFTRDLTITGDMVAPSINDVDLAQTVERQSLNEQVIGGTKHFIQGLKVDGQMEVDYLDGFELRLAHSSALFKDENATILGNLILRNIVTMGSNLNVETTVNGVNMADLERQLKLTMPRSRTYYDSIVQTINDTNLLLKARGDLSELLYLEPVLQGPMPISNTQRAVSMLDSDGKTRLKVYGLTSDTSCGLPESCPCPAQHSLLVHGQSLNHATWTSGPQMNSLERSFIFHIDQAHLTVLVKTNTVSFSSQCRLFGEGRNDELTMITWTENDEKNPSVLGPTIANIEPSPILGYVKDVKHIFVDDQVYLVIGISYSPELDSGDVHSVVVHINKALGKAQIVSKFLTHGVSVLDVFYTERGPHVVVGNTYDSKRRSSKVYLDIYRFSGETKELVLIKNIPADDVVAVASVVQGGDNLIIMAQKQLFAPVMVLKYNPAQDDYHFMQQLNPNTIPTGLGVFYIGEADRSDAFLGVSTNDDLFYLYKFCHIEGFKLVMKMELEGVQGFTTFSDGLKQYLFFTSSKTSSIFEIVKQSS